jgi:dTDP-4-dehydrorhamnose 3,5-epimerase
MRVIPQAIPDVLLIEPQVFADERGFFMETYQAERYAGSGVRVCFVQDNISWSTRGILRGLHLQHPHDQGKLVGVLEGEVFDVAVDVRVGSPTFGRWVGVVLSGGNHHQLYVPPGFAHGFCVTSEYALFSYKCSEIYHPKYEIGVAFNDPEIGIRWPIDQPQLSAKDLRNCPLSCIDPRRLPHHRAAFDGTDVPSRDIADSVAVQPDRD